MFGVEAFEFCGEVGLLGEGVADEVCQGWGDLK